MSLTAFLDSCQFATPQPNLSRWAICRKSWLDVMGSQKQTSTYRHVYVEDTLQVSVELTTFASLERRSYQAAWPRDRRTTR